MYHPRTWTTLAERLAAGIGGDGAPILNSMWTPVELDSTKKATPSKAGEAVLCIDGPEYGGLGNVARRKAVEAMIEEDVLVYEKIVHEFAGLEVGSFSLICIRALFSCSTPFLGLHVPPPEAESY